MMRRVMNMNEDSHAVEAFDSFGECVTVVLWGAIQCAFGKGQFCKIWAAMDWFPVVWVSIPNVFLMSQRTGVTVTA